MAVIHVEVPMNARPRRPLPESLIGKISALPLHRIAEIEDFVDFIGKREERVGIANAATVLSAPAFAVIWDNPEDEVYDAL
jgi:hypothetical protein